MHSLSSAVASAPLAATAPGTQAVLAHYADLAQAGYDGALTAARKLQGAIGTLIAAPTEPNLQAARTAWKAARAPNHETQAFRLRNPMVDAWKVG